MSAWYIFNTLGMYPVNPASAEYLVGSPIFDKVEVTLPRNGHSLTISAPDARSSPFVKSLSLDGEYVLEPVIHHVDLYRVMNIDYEMSTEPQLWGADAL